ncbi:hypothetical protein [Ferruginibacter profundus]
MLKEEFLTLLLKEVYDKETLAVYDYTATIFTPYSEDFANTKRWADQLVRDKLAIYSDAEHTTLQLTNFGKYWILHGGYDLFLKEGQSCKSHSKEKEDAKLPCIRKDELLEARLKLTHYRIVGFWLMIVISSMGFLLSLYNLYLIWSGRK